MNKILEIIYQSYAEMPLEISPFETMETLDAYNDFVDTYLVDNLPYPERREAQKRFAFLLRDYQQKAFEAGFKTAVQLLTGADYNERK